MSALCLEDCGRSKVLINILGFRFVRVVYNFIYLASSDLVQIIFSSSYLSATKIEERFEITV